LIWQSPAFSFHCSVSSFVFLLPCPSRSTSLSVICPSQYLPFFMSSLHTSQLLYPCLHNPHISYRAAKLQTVFGSCMLRTLSGTPGKGADCTSIRHYRFLPNSFQLVTTSVIQCYITRVVSYSYPHNRPRRPIGL
jgi:hypothetical protein